MIHQRPTFTHWCVVQPFLLAVWNTEAIVCPDKVIQFHCYAEGKVEQQGEACVALSQWVLLWKIYSLMRVM